MSTPLCKLGTVKRQAGGSNMPTIHGKWIAEPGSTMERCHDWHTVLVCWQNRGPAHLVLWMAHVATSLRKCLEQLQPGSAGGKWGKPAAKPRAESTRPLWHRRREGREYTKILKHGVPIRRVAQAAPRASTGLTRTDGPFRMRNLPSH